MTVSALAQYFLKTYLSSQLSVIQHSLIKSKNNIGNTDRLEHFRSAFVLIYKSFRQKKVQEHRLHRSILLDPKPTSWDEEYLSAYIGKYSLPHSLRVAISPEATKYTFVDLLSLGIFLPICLLDLNGLMFLTFTQVLGFSRWLKISPKVKTVYFRNPYRNYESLLTLKLNQQGIKTAAYSWVLPLDYPGLIVNQFDVGMKFNLDLLMNSKTILYDSAEYIPFPHITKISKIERPCVGSLNQVIYFATNVRSIERFSSEQAAIRAFCNLSKMIQNLNFMVCIHYLNRENRGDVDKMENLIRGSRVKLAPAEIYGYEAIKYCDLSFSAISSIGIEFLEAGFRNHYIYIDSRQYFRELLETSHAENICDGTVDSEMVSTFQAHMSKHVGSQFII